MESFCIIEEIDRLLKAGAGSGAVRVLFHCRERLVAASIRRGNHCVRNVYSRVIQDRHEF